MTRSHDTLVTDQFGTQAQAYVASTVHAMGADLDRLSAIAAEAKGGRALDLGCGGGHVTYRLAAAMAAVTAYDLSEDMLAAVTAEAARRGLGNIETRQGPAEKLPFADASFDFAATRYSAHHWGDWAAGLREARRVLRPGGRAVFIDIASPGTALLDTHLQTIELLRDPSHVRDYAQAEWIAGLTAAGFAVKTATLYPVRIDFASWIARMRTPDVQTSAIRALQNAASATIRERFQIGEDGSFTMETIVIEAI